MFKKRKRFLSIIICILVILTTLNGCGNEPQESDIKETVELIAGEFANIDSNLVDPQNIMDIITRLSSEAFEGRLTGSKGNQLAVDYIADYFRKIGIENPKGIEDYRQFYKQNTFTMNSAPGLKIVDDKGNEIKEYEYITDFTTSLSASSIVKGEKTGQLLFIEKSDQITTSNESLRDKILLVSEELLMEGIGGKIRQIADQIGVKGLIYEQSVSNKETYGHLLAYASPGNSMGITNDNGYIYSFVTTETFDELVNASNKGQLLHMTMDFTTEIKEVANVVGIIEGADEELKDDFILITAHMDHVGSNKNGTYNPGALDNGSGTATMMEVARVLKESGKKPKRSILFIAFNGEEEGLLGSSQYVRRPLYPLDNNDVVINLDMVGSKSDLPLSIASFDVVSSTLQQDMWELSRDLNIDSIEAGLSNSDHASFNHTGIDAITLIELDHKSIHYPGDTIDVIDQEEIGQVAEFVLYYIDRKAY